MASNYKTTEQPCKCKVHNTNGKLIITFMGVKNNAGEIVTYTSMDYDCDCKAIPEYYLLNDECDCVKIFTMADNIS